MAHSKNIAGLLGPAIIAVTASETVKSISRLATLLPEFISMAQYCSLPDLLSSARIISGFVAGRTDHSLRLVQHAPGPVQDVLSEGAKHTSTVSIGTILLLAVGVFLAFKAYRLDMN